ncbi:uncharacterized protein TNCV_3866401 [Trichonephila clavipes]|nr:uncharacterized protein TNCV_3866401 [Trichonephila clavipes]
MFYSSSYDNPTPLARADTSRDVLPRGGASQWCPTKFNLYDPEIRNARRFTVWPKVYLSGSENVTEFLEGIDCEDPLGSHFDNENNFESKKNQ